MKNNPGMSDRPYDMVHMNHITCQSDRNSTTGSGEPARIVGVELSCMMTVK